MLVATNARYALMHFIRDGETIQRPLLRSRVLATIRAYRAEKRLFVICVRASICWEKRTNYLSLPNYILPRITPTRLLSLPIGYFIKSSRQLFSRYYA